MALRPKGSGPRGGSKKKTPSKELAPRNVDRHPDAIDVEYEVVEMPGRGYERAPAPGSTYREAMEEMAAREVAAEAAPKGRRWLRNLGIAGGLTLGGVGAKSAYDYFTDDGVDDYRDSQMMALLSGIYDNAIDQGGEASYLGDLESQMRTALRHQPIEARTPRPRPTASSELTGLLTESDIMRLASMRQKQMRTREQILAELGVY